MGVTDTTAQIEQRLAMSALHCPNCKALVICAGNGTMGSPWVIPGHVNPADSEPCPEAGMAWTRRQWS